ncbi:CHRD domain-containing protein [Pseudonocardia broussonetiae]|uniref:CHRD domain-containing protein n=1 Tax=Pseudonocardia broussonetiae TaxID=2736640 RepID=A0A6M6JNI1_9PSEU|nr:CHRD domain-containing protein [Pseudonocardia broussonetiae]QJY48162.1 CHRD domain-containing protein [Pseudonocardia broussonetiae]
MRRTVRRVAILTALTTSAVALSAGVASAQDAEVPEPSSFTSMITAMATPDAVVNPDGVVTPGEPGATGTFDYRINSELEIICYDITLRGVTPPYMSPARTATHIHQAAEGAAGPPRIAFPDPQDAGDGILRSEGCLQGPFTTGIMANGADTGEGFSLAAIEADPSAFSTDTHTATFTAGAVRGQLTSVPMGGVATGAGGTAGGGSWAPAALGAAALVGAAGTVLVRRRAQQD